VIDKVTTDEIVVRIKNIEVLESCIATGGIYLFQPNILWVRDILKTPVRIK